MPWDLCMQAGHQTQAYRLCQYFDNPDTRRRLFPGAFFSSGAHEAGRRSEHLGAAIAIFSGLEEGPEAVLRWFLGAPLIRRHVTRIYWLYRRADHAPDAAAPQQEPQQEPAQLPSSSHFSGSNDHITSRQELLEDIVAAGLHKGLVMRVHCSPKSLEKFLEEQLPEDFDLHPQSFTHVLQAVEADGWLRWSVVPAQWLYRQSTDEPKALPDSVAHAVHKLDEALIVSGVSLGGARLHAAIDLGAAPGAWSMYLSTLADLVIAVDPAQLHPYAVKDNIKHVRKKAEEAIPEIEQLLNGSKADVLTCDMNMHPARASQAIQGLLPLLRPGGVVVLTLKFNGTGRDRSKTCEQLRALYAGVLGDGVLVWLLANTICEQTWVATKL